MHKYKDNQYDIVVECNICHHLAYTQSQLNTQSEVNLVKRVLKSLFATCPYCNSSDMHITVSNEYYRPEDLVKNPRL